MDGLDGAYCEKLELSWHTIGWVLVGVSERGKILPLPPQERIMRHILSNLFSVPTTTAGDRRSSSPVSTADLKRGLEDAAPDAVTSDDVLTDADLNDWLTQGTAC